MMHPHPSFAWTDRDALIDFVAEAGFATIMICGPGGPRIVHVPVVVSTDRRSIRFHLSRANRAAVSEGEGVRGLLSCLGQHAYISPDWYGTKDQVPTWNYVAVECEGSLRRLTQDELTHLLDDLGGVNEARLAPKPVWTRDKMSAGRFETMLKAIVGYELAIEELRGTRKLGQNKDANERAAAADGLEATGAVELAQMMRNARA
jgi:transcriptional regulator